MNGAARVVWTILTAAAFGCFFACSGTTGNTKSDVGFVQGAATPRSAAPLDKESPESPSRTAAAARPSRPASSDAASADIPVVAAPLATDIAESHPSVMRTWTDSTGRYVIVAALLEMRNGWVRLKKEDGQYAELPVNRLSTSDQKYVDTVGERPSAVSFKNAIAGDPESMVTVRRPDT